MILGRLGLVVAAALTLCACTPDAAGAVASTGQPPGTGIVERIDNAGDTLVLNGTKSLIIASNAYQGAAAAITPLVAAGVFDAEQLARIRTLNSRAFNSLELGRQGINTASRAAEVFDVVAELDLLAGVRR